MTTSPDRAGLREAAWCGDRNPHRSHQGPPRCKGVSYREAGILRAALATTEPGLHCAGCEGWTSSGSKCEGVLAAPVAVERRFTTVNDFMHYTHDTIDMHRGLMVPGCVYCNGDM